MSASASASSTQEEDKAAEMSFGEIVQVVENIYIDESWPLECALRLEDHLSKSFKHGKPYNDKSRSLLFNLGDSKNPNPRLALLTKSVTPEEFLTIDIRRLASDEIQR